MKMYPANLAVIWVDTGRENLTVNITSVLPHV